MNISIYLREALKSLRINNLELYDIYWMPMIDPRATEYYNSQGTIHS